MHIVAFLIAIAALIVFIYDWAKSKALLPLGLALLTAAWILTLILRFEGEGVHLTL